MNDVIIDSIVQIGNLKKVKKMCEPQVMQPLQLENWMVVRTLKAIELIQEAYEIQRSQLSNNGVDGQDGGKSVCKVPKKRNSKT